MQYLSLELRGVWSSEHMRAIEPIIDSYSNSGHDLKVDDHDADHDNPAVVLIKYTTETPSIPKLNYKAVNIEHRIEPYFQIDNFLIGNEDFFKYLAIRNKKTKMFGCPRLTPDAYYKDLISSIESGTTSSTLPNGIIIGEECLKNEQHQVVTDPTGIKYIPTLMRLIDGSSSASFDNSQLICCGKKTVESADHDIYDVTITVDAQEFIKSGATLLKEITDL